MQVQLLSSSSPRILPFHSSINAAFSQQTKADELFIVIAVIAYSLQCFLFGHLDYTCLFVSFIMSASVALVSLSLYYLSCSRQTGQRLHRNAQLLYFF